MQYPGDNHFILADLVQNPVAPMYQRPYALAKIRGFLSCARTAS
jgi:hypothetical protein